MKAFVFPIIICPQLLPHFKKAVKTCYENCQSPSEIINLVYFTFLIFSLSTNEDHIQYQTKIQFYAHYISLSHSILLVSLFTLFSNKFLNFLVNYNLFSNTNLNFLIIQKFAVSFILYKIFSEGY
ncbi:Protein of unknown function [Gryllus bimaculatus]|nr:Protein of unknown function [Gryllus bimaculatus]